MLEHEEWKRMFVGYKNIFKAPITVQWRPRSSQFLWFLKAYSSLWKAYIKTILYDNSWGLNKQILCLFYIREKFMSILLNVEYLQFYKSIIKIAFRLL